MEQIEIPIFPMENIKNILVKQHMDMSRNLQNENYEECTLIKTKIENIKQIIIPSVCKNMKFNQKQSEKWIEDYIQKLNKKFIEI